MKKLSAFIFLSFTLLFSECKKYPDGPALSLRSKKERIANTWKVNQLKIDGVDSTSYYTNLLQDYTITFTKSGNYTISYYISIPSFGNIPNSENGTWAFSSNKENLDLKPSSIFLGDLPSQSTWQILKLYEKELWLSSSNFNGKKTEFHLLPK